MSLLDSTNLTNGTREDVEWLVNLLLRFFVEANNVSNYYGEIIVCIHNNFFYGNLVCLKIL